MLAVAGGKGGCGKTTLAVALARALARVGSSPLVVDADTEIPDLHRLLDIPAEPSTDDLPASDAGRVAHRPTSLPGVAAIPAGTRRGLPAALRCAREWHGPVLVDTPAGCGRGVTVPLRLADRSLVLTTDRPQGREDARKTGRLARRVGASPAGTVVRETVGGGQRAEPPADLRPLLSRVPRASEPLADPRVDAACVRLAARLEPVLAAERPAAGANRSAGGGGPEGTVGPARRTERFGSRSGVRASEGRNI